MILNIENIVTQLSHRYIATISFAVTITPHIAVNFECHKLENGHVTLALKPKAKMRIGGGAVASLAVAVQGGIDVGVDLNYYVDTETGKTKRKSRSGRGRISLLG